MPSSDTRRGNRPLFVCVLLPPLKTRRIVSDSAVTSARGKRSRERKCQNGCGETQTKRALRSPLTLIASSFGLGGPRTAAGPAVSHFDPTPRIPRPNVPIQTAHGAAESFRELLHLPSPR